MEYLLYYMLLTPNKICEDKGYQNTANFVHSNVNKKRVTVTGDSMVKFVKSENLLDENYIANIRTNPGCTTNYIANYIEPIIIGKPDIMLVHTGTNILQTV